MRHAAFLSLLTAIMLLLTACAAQAVSDANAGADINDASDHAERFLPDNTPEELVELPAQEADKNLEDSENDAPESMTDTSAATEPADTPLTGTEPAATEEAISEKPAQPQVLILMIDSTPVEVQWESNQTVDELAAYSQNEMIVVNASRYGGFEQVGSLPQSFSRNDAQATTEPGDIVLYSGDQLVVFFGSNAWSYTRLGHIEGLSTDELAALLDKDTTVIEIKND